MIKLPCATKTEQTSVPLKLLLQFEISKENNLENHQCFLIGFKTLVEMHREQSCQELPLSLSSSSSQH